MYALEDGNARRISKEGISSIWGLSSRSLGSKINVTQAKNFKSSDIAKRIIRNKNTDPDIEDLEPGALNFINNPYGNKKSKSYEGENLTVKTREVSKNRYLSYVAANLNSGCIMAMQGNGNLLPNLKDMMRTYDPKHKFIMPKGGKLDDFLKRLCNKFDTRIPKGTNAKAKVLQSYFERLNPDKGRILIGIDCIDHCDLNNYDDQLALTSLVTKFRVGMIAIFNKSNPRMFWTGLGLPDILVDEFWQIGEPFFPPSGHNKAVKGIFRINLEQFNLEERDAIEIIFKRIRNDTIDSKNRSLSRPTKKEEISDITGFGRGTENLLRRLVRHGFLKKRKEDAKYVLSSKKVYVAINNLYSSNDSDEEEKSADKEKEQDDHKEPPKKKRKITNPVVKKTAPKTPATTKKRQRLSRQCSAQKKNYRQ